MIVGVIPARWKSSRFPGKPLAHILGKSLIQRTYENALKCTTLDTLVIATDDVRIADHAHDFGAKAFMTSDTCPSGTERVWEVINEYFNEAGIIVNIQGDEPCLDPQVIDILVQKLASTPEAILTTPVSKIKDPRLVIKSNIVKCVFDQKGRALYFSRSPIPFVQKPLYNPDYYRHIGVYCFRREFMQHYVRFDKTPLQRSEDLEQLTILENGFPIHVCIVEDQAVGVDTPEDLTAIEMLLCQKENIFL